MVIFAVLIRPFVEVKIIGSLKFSSASPVPKTFCRNVDESEEAVDNWQ